MCCGCRFFVSAVPNRRNKKMAESMKGLKRTCRCAEVTKADIGKKVTLMGWVQKSRNKGGIIFVDLRDRSGIMQIIFENGPISEEGFEKAAKLRSEFVIAVEGEVMARSGAVNENLATGELEVKAESLRILSEAETPPFPIEEDSKTREELRLKYRYLDLRRPDIQRNLIMRSKVAMLTREFIPFSLLFHELRQYRPRKGNTIREYHHIYPR